MTYFLLKRAKVPFRTKQRISNFQTETAYVPKQLEAQLTIWVGYKEKRVLFVCRQGTRQKIIVNHFIIQVIR